jgi:hypothetical protein
VTIARKLQIRPATTVVVMGRPAGVDLEIPSDCLVVSDPEDAGTADAVVAFVVRADDLEGVGRPALDAARDDRLAWLLYPKNRQLGTDLNRDVLAALAAERGAQPVRQVAVDAVWSGLRLRPV